MVTPAASMASITFQFLSMFRLREMVMVAKTLPAAFVRFVIAITRVSLYAFLEASFFFHTLKIALFGLKTGCLMGWNAAGSWASSCPILQYGSIRNTAIAPAGRA